MKEIFLVGIGGFIGSSLRYSVGLLPFGNSKLNVATLIVNLVGSFLIGFLSAYFLKSINQNYQLFIVTGFCGGFTTYSTFSLHLLRYMEGENYVPMIAYLTMSLLGGVALCYLGLSIGSKIFN